MVLVGGGGGERLVVIGGWIERELTAKRERERKVRSVMAREIYNFFFFYGRERSIDLS
jgi:hypothetical protein